MSWDDFYRRRDALNAVLEHAGRNPDGPLPYDAVPDAAQIFANPAELLAALQYKWTMALTGRLDVALAEAERDPTIDTVDAMAAAYRATTAEHPVLRRLLDRNEGAARPALAGEQRLLALVTPAT